MKEVANGLWEREFLEDYQPGEVLVSPRRTITETDLTMFAALTADWSEVHTYTKLAEDGPFGQRICHGMLTMTIGNGLMHRLGTHIYSPHGFIAFYGMDKVRFTAPVFVGDSLRCELVGDDGVIKDHTKVLLGFRTDIYKDPDILVCTYSQRSLVRRQPKDADLS